MFQKILYFSLFLTTFSYSFISLEPPVIGEKQGMSGEVSLGAKYNQGNTDSLSVGMAAKAQYDETKWLLYLISAYSYGESNDLKDTNDGIFHLRYVHVIAGTPYDYELYVQTEFNEFQDVKERSLIGGNIRRRFELGFDKFYIGVGMFYAYMEPDEVTELDIIYRRVKMDSYLSFYKKINENFSLTYLGYYQPNIEDFSDFRIFQVLQLTTSITEHTALSFDITHKYNSTPYSHIEKNDVRSIISLKYRFD